jgi:hypothetical protein
VEQGGDEDRDGRCKRTARDPCAALCHAAPVRMRPNPA